MSMSDITPAELAVMRRLAAGEGVKRIAQITDRSKYTIERHLKMVRLKTGTKTSTHAAVLMERAGIFDSDPTAAPDG